MYADSDEPLHILEKTEWVSLNFSGFIYLFYVRVFHLSMCVMLEEYVESPGTGVTESSEASGQCWGPSPPGFLTALLNRCPLMGALAENGGPLGCSEQKPCRNTRMFG